VHVSVLVLFPKETFYGTFDLVLRIVLIHIYEWVCLCIIQLAYTSENEGKMVIDISKTKDLTFESIFV
jgi:hypothetical protein